MMGVPRPSQSSNQATSKSSLPPLLTMTFDGNSGWDGGSKGGEGGEGGGEGNVGGGLVGGRLDAALVPPRNRSMPRSRNPRRCLRGVAVLLWICGGPRLGDASAGKEESDWCFRSERGERGLGCMRWPRGQGGSHCARSPAFLPGLVAHFDQSGFFGAWSTVARCGRGLCVRSPPRLRGVGCAAADCTVDCSADEKLRGCFITNRMAGTGGRNYLHDAWREPGADGNGFRQPF